MTGLWTMPLNINSSLLINLIHFITRNSYATLSGGGYFMKKITELKIVVVLLKNH